MIERLLELLGLTGSTKFYKVVEIYKDGELQRRIVNHSANWSDADDEQMKKLNEFAEEVFEELDKDFKEMRNKWRFRRGRNK